MPKIAILRLLTILSLSVLIPLGIFSKFYTGPFNEWFNNHVGGLLYEIFWCLFVFLLLPTRKAVSQIPLWVFGITCALEFLQLWKTPLLEPIRASLLGKWLLGTTFSSLDFPHYLLGCLMGWLWLRSIWQFSKAPKSFR